MTDTTGIVIATDEDTEVGYMLVNEHTPKTPDERLAMFCLLAAREWDEVFDPRKITGHEEEPIAVVDDPENETWRTPTEGEEPTDRWYVFRGLSEARVESQRTRERLAGEKPPAC